MTRAEAYWILHEMMVETFSADQSNALSIALDDIQLVDLMPNDVVHVVLCKDCKHRGDHEVCPLMDIRLCFDGCGHMDEVEDDKTEDEFFCAFGERKDGE